MKVIEKRYTVTEVEVDEKSYNVDKVKIEEILRTLREKAHSANIDANADDNDYAALEEITGEQLLLVLEEAGALIDVTRDEDGEIESIHASVAVESGVISSIEATGPTPAKILGDLAQTSVDATSNVTASTTTGQVAITFSVAPGVSSGSISGPGIPAGATVTIVGTAGTLSAAATATSGAAALVLVAETQVIGLSEFTVDWKRKTADATTTDDDTYESSLGSTASWSVKAKYMFIDGDTSQAQNILATITSPQSPTTWNFFPTIGTGRGAFSGQAYVDGITIASGMGKVVGLDVSLKGTGKLNFGQQLAPVSNPNTGTGEQAEV